MVKRAVCWDVSSYIEPREDEYEMRPQAGENDPLDFDAEVTDEMIEAGMQIIWQYDQERGDSAEDAVRHIFCAMMAAKGRAANDG